jgi:hypothetical protein
LSASSFWKTAGNAGTVPGANFIGTTDNQSSELKVNGVRALRLEPAANDVNHSNIVNVVGGSPLNFVEPGVYGATIASGAVNYYGSAFSNHVAGDFDTIGGGKGNYANGFAATVGGGDGNIANGSIATVAGGNANTASGNLAAVGGGIDNKASGQDSIIPGGIACTAAGDTSFAAGREA